MHIVKCEEEEDDDEDLKKTHQQKGIHVDLNASLNATNETSPYGESTMHNSLSLITLTDTNTTDTPSMKIMIIGRLSVSRY